MFRPTGFADLAGRRVGILGYGVEGRASHARIRQLAARVVLVDDRPDAGSGVLATFDGGYAALLECDVVLKSPGIPRRRADVLELERRGVVVTSALNLWLLDADRSRVVAITGTKGKSTTTALCTFFLGCLGESAQSRGNIGVPPYDPALPATSDWIVLEVSSYQCVDLEVAPHLVVVTSLGSDHLDWHGSLEQYHDDKLSLTRTAGPHVTLVPDSAQLRAARSQLGGDVVEVAPDDEHLADALGLLGAHNDSNVALALAATSRLSQRSLEEVRRAVLERRTNFEPLRGRLTLVADHVARGGRVRFIDDGLATAPLPVVAALTVFSSEPVVLLAGGFDRGVDYTPLAAALGARRAPTWVLTMAEAGERVGAALDEYAPHVVHFPAIDMSAAVARARSLLDDGGVVLLSPGAPSFGHYRNWEERSDAFARAVLEVNNEGIFGEDSTS